MTLTKPQTIYRATAEPRGGYYRLWALMWPPVRKLISLFPGALGLHPPDAAPESRHPLILQRHQNEAIWWRDYIWSGTRRAVGSGLGELIGLSSVALASWLLVLELLFRSPLPQLELAGVIIFVSAVLFYITGCCAIYIIYLTLRSLPPDVYAHTTLSGKTSADVLRALSYEMRTAAQSFLTDSRFLAKHLDGLIKNEIIDSTHLEELRLKRTELERAWRDLKGRLVQFGESIERLNALTTRASVDLGISHNRLCNHLLQYDPEMHRERADSYIRYWERILQGLSDKNGKDKVARYTKGCQAIEESFSKRVTRLAKLFEIDEDMHSYLRRIISQNSTSGAVIAYAEAVTHVVRNGKGKCIAESAKTLRDNEGYRDLISNLQFLNRKQQAHSGFDLHHTCLRILEEAADNKSFPDAGLKDAAANILAEFRVLDVAPSKFRLIENEMDGRRALTNFFDSWELVDQIVEKQIDYSRTNIKKYFVAFVNKELEKTKAKFGGHTLVVTHGYSKTVREALKRYIKVGQVSEVPKIFILRTSERDTRDARKLIAEIRDRLPPRIGSGLEISIGDKAALIGLLSAGDRVVVVLGAECYDGRGRVVHSRGIKGELDEMTTSFKDKGIWLKVVVVAEAYKQIDSKADVTLARHMRFFRYHLDRLDIYPPETVDIIISENGPNNENCRDNSNELSLAAQ